MSILLDTHAMLWFVLKDPQLSAGAHHAIRFRSADAFISPASFWEVAIKVRRGNYRLTVPFNVFFETALEKNGFKILPITIKHAAQVAELPLIHRDPFDRLIVAQALVEDLSLVTRDSILDQYGIKRIW